jgi:hypothetical protein
MRALPPSEVARDPIFSPDRPSGRCSRARFPGNPAGAEINTVTVASEINTVTVARNGTLRRVISFSALRASAFILSSRRGRALAYVNRTAKNRKLPTGLLAPGIPPSSVLPLPPTARETARRARDTFDTPTVLRVEN